MAGSSGHDPSSLWDWDSVLLLAHPIGAATGDNAVHSVDAPTGDASHQGTTATTAPREQEEQQVEQNPRQRRRRDPRLSCPNFLAGRVPCACSDEEDEEEEDRSRKRPKQSVRCQVSTCRAELSGLKGYHQRHRVCLNCANAASVFLRNQNQRYCQQCGKFHPLADFDHDKRSCRRKLEKHNDRRRRRLPEVQSPPPEPMSKEASTTTQNSDKDAAPTNNTNTSDETPPDLYCFHSHDQRLQAKSQQLQLGGYDHTLDTSVTSDQSLLALLLDEQAAHDEAQQQNENHPGPSASSSGFRKRPGAYTSPCPTRRISFKFYDWNPADFPRRLREQILEWLANMPVELEGYIRSGCTILTLFIAMPESGWTKLHGDWTGYLAKLVSGTETGFWDRGFVAAFLDNKVAYIDRGLVSSPSLCERASRKYPVLSAAFPMCLQAGTKARVTVVGENLIELNARLLLGSGGKYLPRYVSKGNSSTSLQIDLVTPLRYGVVLIEMAFDHGISNFIPLLIGDKELCQEAEALSRESFFRTKQKETYDLLLDLGWLMRKSQAASPEKLKIPATNYDLCRLKQLLLFSIERGWCATARRVLQVAGALDILTQIDMHGALRLATMYDKADVLKVLLTFHEQMEAKNREVALTSCTVTNGFYYSSASQSVRHPLLWAITTPRWQWRSRRKDIFKLALGFAVACAGACIMYQHPHQVVELSTSLRRCLWHKPTSGS